MREVDCGALATEREAMLARRYYVDGEVVDWSVAADEVADAGTVDAGLDIAQGVKFAVAGLGGAVRADRDGVVQDVAVGDNLVGLAHVDGRDDALVDAFGYFGRHLE